MTRPATGTMLLLLVLQGLLRPELAAQEKTPAAPAPAATGVAAILADHDRALIRDLAAYLAANPRAADRDQAYLVLFERAIENDWYADNQATAGTYLQVQPDGPVAPLARIIVTMGQAEAGQYDAALASYRALMEGLNDPSQEEFAVNFAESLANRALADGRHEVARAVYQALLKPFGESPTIAQRVTGELERLDLVGRPAPAVVARDFAGATLRLGDLRGKFVLVDFWATWCEPCVEDLPRLRALYDSYHDRGFEIVSVSLDEGTQPVTDFVRARGIPWTQLHQGTSQADLVAAFKVGSIPASFLIGPDGDVLRINPRGASLESLLRDRLK